MIPAKLYFVLPCFVFWLGHQRCILGYRFLWRELFSTRGLGYLIAPYYMNMQLIRINYSTMLDLTCMSQSLHPVGLLSVLHNAELRVVLESDLYCT